MDVDVKSQSKARTKSLLNNGNDHFRPLTESQDYQHLERRFADSVLDFERMGTDNQTLTQELHQLQTELDNAKGRCRIYEKTVEELESEKGQLCTFYTQLVDSLQQKVSDLEMELRHQDNSTLLDKVIRDYKILENQFEVEKNSKLVLMDQVEFLAHKNDNLLKQIHMGSCTMEDSATDNTSIRVNTDFQFPPSPDPDSKSLKRQSLPAELKPKPKPKPFDTSEFVLSPFKLTSANTFNDGAGSTDGDGDDDANTSIVKRYSSSKPTHIRYNSHDILPVQVEFEEQRVSSMPEYVKPSPPPIPFDVIQESMDDYRNGTLFALNGYDTSHGISYDEIESSSKRSSYIQHDSRTRQEITKLKFELQSLKLHNEKLLSYIGFELQKQKKNIKKLAKKQSLNSMSYEYSDAKLIKDSRDLLINKKRVLRSVSINAAYDDLITTPGIATLGLKTPQSAPHYEETNFVNDKIVKKFASQVFSRADLSSLDEVDSDIDTTWQSNEEEDDDDDDEEEEEKERLIDEYASSSEEESGMLTHIRHLVMGKDTKYKNKEDLVDDSLKFKFLTIALGIMIVGFKLTPQSQVRA